MLIMKNVLRILALIWATMSPSIGSAQGQSLDDVANIAFLPGWRMSSDTHIGAIRIDLAAGWKTYWRAPGDGGVPTVLSLRDSAGVVGASLHWPIPEVFYINGLQSIGYGGQVILPVIFDLSQSGAIDMQGQLDFGICQDVCMPVSVNITATLPSQGRENAAIMRALSDRPMTATQAGATAPRCQFRPIDDGMQMALDLTMPALGGRETVVVEHQNPEIWISTAQTTRAGGVITSVVDLVPPSAGPFALGRSDLTITVIGAGRAVEFQGCQN